MLVGLGIEVESTFKRFWKKHGGGEVGLVDLHPIKPWVLVSVRFGNVFQLTSFDYEANIYKCFESTQLPVVSAKYIARKKWVVAGAKDKFIRVYNYKTMDKVKAFEAHTDTIRCVAVHPSLPYVLSSSDDKLIKLWDWKKGWLCTRIFEGHSDVVMQVSFNPKDTNTFASASLDGTIKIWNLDSPGPNFTLNAHSEGVNCVDYFTYGDKPYLITGSNDHTVKVWNYETRRRVRKLYGHTHNVSAVCFHPELPIIVTASEDGTVRIWHSTKHRIVLYRKMKKMEGVDLFGRVWAVGYVRGSRRVVIGSNKGAVMLNFGSKAPVASMDSEGKIIRTKYYVTKAVNITNHKVAEGMRLPLAVKYMGAHSFRQQTLKHSPNGKFVVVCGEDGECIVHKASDLASTPITLNFAHQLVWSSEGEFAVRESTSKIKIFSKNFMEKKSISPTFSAKRIFGGKLLAMCSNDLICFYDWAECRLIWRFHLDVKYLYWADSVDLVAIANDTSFYILKYNRDVVSAHQDSGRSVDEQGVEDAFVFLDERSEGAQSGLWVEEYFIYISASSRLNYWLTNYWVAGEVTTVVPFDQPMYLLGYLANTNRVYLMDEDYNVVSYTFVRGFIEYMSLLMRGGTLEEASAVLPSIPKERLYSVARFLEEQDMAEDALKSNMNIDYKFELAIRLGREDVAENIYKAYRTKSMSHTRNMDYQFGLEGMLWKNIIGQGKAVQLHFPEPTDLTPPPPLLQLIQVGFSYPNREDFRLSDVDVGIDMGTLVVIVGPNGAGKSTLLNLLAGDLEPTEGEVRRSQKLRIGRYSQHFVDLLTMGETAVQYLLRLHPDQEAVRAKLGKFGVASHNHLTPIAELSGGQKARVVFTSISMSKPHVLLLDEPTNHLDVQSIDALADALDEFTGGVVLVSHDSRLVLRVCKNEERSQIWVVKDGKVEAFPGAFEEYKDAKAQLDDCV